MNSSVCCVQKLSVRTLEKKCLTVSKTGSRNHFAIVLYRLAPPKKKGKTTTVRNMLFKIDEFSVFIASLVLFFPILYFETRTVQRKGVNLLKTFFWSFLSHEPRTSNLFSINTRRTVDRIYLVTDIYLLEQLMSPFVLTCFG